MRIPVVLSVVHVAIDANGILAVDVDGVPRDSEQTRTRDHLRAVIDEITSDVGAPVRVEVREADGSTFTDVATPPTPAPAARDRPSRNLPPPQRCISRGGRGGRPPSSPRSRCRSPRRERSPRPRPCPRGRGPPPARECTGRNGPAEGPAVGRFRVGSLPAGRRCPAPRQGRMPRGPPPRADGPRRRWTPGRSLLRCRNLGRRRADRRRGRPRRVWGRRDETPAALAVELATQWPP